MICTKTGKNCGYNTWYQQRLEIIKITIKYLETRMEEIQQKLQEIEDEEEYINGFPIIVYEYYIEKLNKYLMEPIKRANNDEIYKFVSHPDIYHIKDVLSCFGVYGIHLLCRQGDCGGVYSVGESLDILQLFKTIKPYFDTSSQIYETVYTIKSEFSSPIYNVFEDSVNTLQPIRIT